MDFLNRIISMGFKSGQLSIRKLTITNLQNDTSFYGRKLLLFRFDFGFIMALTVDKYRLSILKEYK